MDRDKILEISRRENQNRDLAQLDVVLQAGNIAGRVGASVCCLLSVLSSYMAGVVLYSPWVIYFSILGTHYLVRYQKIRRGTDLLLCGTFFAVCLVALVLLILRLAGKPV